MKFLARAFCVLALLAMIGGCRTMQPIAHEKWSNVTSNVEVGDTVELTTNDGRALRFVVTEVTGDALVGQEVRVAADEIRQLKVHAVSKGRTTALAAGGGAVAAFIAFGLAVAALLGGGG